MPTDDWLRRLPRIAVRVTTEEEASEARRILAKLDGNEIHDDYQDVVTGFVTPPIYKELLEAHLMVVSSGIPEGGGPPQASLPFLGVQLYATMGVGDGVTGGGGVEPEMDGTPYPEPEPAPQELPSAEEPLAERAMLLDELTTESQANPVEQPETLAADEAQEPRRMYKVTLAGPMRSQWVEKLASLEIKISSFEPPFTYRMLLTEAERDTVAALEFVRGEPERFALADTVSPEFLDDYEEALKQGDQAARLFDLTVHEADQLPRVKAMLASIGADLVGEAGNSVRFSAPISPRLASLADCEEVKRLAPFRKMSLLLDQCRTMVGLPAAGSPACQRWAWDGSGEIVAVIDSGVQADHPGFQRPDGTSRVTPLALPGLGTEDRVGHGTHVAGIIAAGNAPPGGPHAVVGLAPGASIVSLRIVDDAGGLVLDPDLTRMLETVVAQDARIINMSWAARKISGRYDTYSETVDAFVRKHPEVLVVIASGNEGTTRHGYPLYTSAGTPATAKNAIAVGACHSTRATFPITYRQYRAGDFAESPFADLPLGGDCRYVAGFSSRGPTDSQSIKPDVIAPGTFILSLRAQCGTIPDAKGVTRPASYDSAGYDHDRYLFLHGTSMAAPFVAGAAAVLRHYLRAGLNVSNPSAALLKVILCASTVRADPAIDQAVRQEVGYPDFDQGFGRLDLSAVIPALSDTGARRIAFVDIGDEAKEALLSRLPKTSTRRSSRIYKVTLNGGAFSAVLAWTDLPGRGLQNVLQLDVENRAADIQIVGNHLHKWGKDRLPIAMDPAPIPYDRTNNVQGVSIENAPAGTYRITVRADNTPIPGEAQGFALCVRGDLASDLVEITA